MKLVQEEARAVRSAGVTRNVVPRVIAFCGPPSGAGSRYHHTQCSRTCTAGRTSCSSGSESRRFISQGPHNILGKRLKIWQMLPVPRSHSLVSTPVCAFLMALLKGSAILCLVSSLAMAVLSAQVRGRLEVCRS